MTDQRTTSNRRPLLPEEVEHLAEDLVKSLSQHVGHPDDVNEVLLTWLGEHDVDPLGLVYLAAVRLVFARCLHRVALNEVPPNAVVLHHVPATADTPN